MARAVGVHCPRGARGAGDGAEPPRAQVAPRRSAGVLGKVLGAGNLAV